MGDSTDKDKGTLNSHLLELARQRPRNLDARGRLLDTSVSVTLNRAEEVAAAAIGALLLKSVCEQGQTRAHSGAIDGLLENLLGPRTAEEVMRLEIEAYEVLRWLTQPAPAESGKPVVAVRRSDAILYDPRSSTGELVAKAIEDGFDLKIDYFSRRRGQMNTRIITPRRVDAETYLSAWCHARKADRVFRLNRITRCIPIQGKAVHFRANDPTEATGAAEPIQVSLLDLSNED